VVPKIVLLGVIAVVASATAAEKPPPSQGREIGLREEVSVRLMQVEVTVWPRAGGAAQCAGFTKDDFELTVGGKPRRIVAVDHVETLRTSEASAPASPGAAAVANAPGGLRLVLFFDLWHLNFFRDLGFMCPPTQPFAFDLARRMVREQMHANDRLLLVTFAGWPLVHYGWLRGPDEALDALDRLETTRAMVAPRRDHLHENEWVEGLKSLMLALGRYPGRKDLIYLGDDLPIGEIGWRLSYLAAAAQTNQVVFQSVDLLVSCRSTPGPACSPPVPGGLDCTDYETPLSLGPLAWATGGELHRTDSIADAVASIRERSACRYVISFETREVEGRGAPPALRIDLLREGFRLRAPQSFQDPSRAPTERARLDAEALLPRFGQGLYAEGGIWPLRPGEKRKRWSGLLVVRIGRDASSQWVDETRRVTVEVTALQGSRVRGAFRKTIEGEQLRRLRDGGHPELMVFPVKDLRAGEIAVFLRATADPEGMSAVARVDSEIPVPPLAGEARPWFLVDRLVRIGDNATLFPSLDGIIGSGDERVVLGYGCPGGTLTNVVPAARLVGPGKQSRLLPVAWLDAPEDERCAWLVARITGELDPGVWRFEPPPGLSEGKRSPGFDFRVARMD